MNIILTGATSGIGFETMKDLVKDGHKVVAVARNFEKIRDFLDEAKDNVVCCPLDLSEVSEIENLFKNLDFSEKFDALIHCAGMEETVPLTLYNPEKIERIYKLNVFSGIELLRHFTKKKYSNEGASVVFMSSVMGVLGQPGKIGYCSTKSAVVGLVKSAALEFAKRKIRINAVLPGVVDTPMTQNLFSQLSEDNVKDILEMHPLGIGKTEDVVPTIKFLISSGSKWITGQNIIIDGGYSIQ
ncbi:SDR family oxidoreductase [Chryseobacterium sp. MEBOG06]|uniref:SDR family NAD(P)-dependent oxidoreductase n=1 Tax=Chryseobacterium sp. MEBOG06 TaxID=2879938 RepID=UPI001F30BE6B|nr:SDR family oxidoreductase [Chryseobacterium sp. MEBOG06]UKB83000.1 SDR family oxidoreductase [Chryseobacterium sp. MEBOG06]